MSECERSDKNCDTNIGQARDWPSNDVLFAAYWKDQERTNFYSHGPAQIAEGLRNVWMAAIRHVQSTPSSTASLPCAWMVTRDTEYESREFFLTEETAMANAAIDEDQAEFLREAQAQLANVIERGDIEAVRWMARAAESYHDQQESCADSMGVPESAEYHRKRREQIAALLSPSATAFATIKEVIDILRSKTRSRLDRQDREFLAAKLSSLIEHSSNDISREGEKHG